MTYLLTATGVIFLSVIVSLLIPEGKLNKTITFVMRIICIFVLIQPVVTLFTQNALSEEGQDLTDYAYVCTIYSDWQSRELEAVLEEEFGKNFDCFVEVEYSDGEFAILSVTVNSDENSQNFIVEVYEYLEELGYINISVYAGGG